MAKTNEFLYTKKECCGGTWKTWINMLALLTFFQFWLAINLSWGHKSPDLIGLTILNFIRYKQTSNQIYNLYINLACLSGCLFVCLYPINVKTAEPIGPKFFMGHHVTTGKVYEWSKFQIFVSIKIRSSLNFQKFWKSTKFFVKIRELFLFCFTMYTKTRCSQLIKKMGAKRPIRLVLVLKYSSTISNPSSNLTPDLMNKSLKYST